MKLGIILLRAEILDSVKWRRYLICVHVWLLQKDDDEIIYRR